MTSTAKSTRNSTFLGLSARASAPRRRGQATTAPWSVSPGASAWQVKGRPISILRRPLPPSGWYRMATRTIPLTTARSSLACLPLRVAWPYTSTIRKMSGQASGTMLSSVSS